MRCKACAQVCDSPRSWATEHLWLSLQLPNTLCNSSSLKLQECIFTFPFHNWHSLNCAFKMLVEGKINASENSWSVFHKRSNFVTQTNPLLLSADISHLTNITTKDAYLMKHSGLRQKNQICTAGESWTTSSGLTYTAQKRNIYKTSVYMRLGLVSPYLLVTFHVCMLKVSLKRFILSQNSDEIFLASLKFE